MTRGTRRPAAAAALGTVVLGLAGCGGSTHTATSETGLPSAGVARARLEYFIAADLRGRAHDAGLGAKLRVRSVHCVRHGRTRYVCRIRTSSTYSKAAVDETVADAFYNPRTEQAGYDIRP